MSGAAISRGRVFFVSSDAVYAIGPKAPKALTGFAVDEPAVKGEGAPAFVQVSPTELVLKPGQTVKLRARLFDAQGPVPARGDGGDLVARRAEGHGAPTARSRAGAGPAGSGRHHQGDGRRRSRARRARASSAPLPWTETFEALRGRRGAAGWINAVDRQVLGRHARRPEGAAEGARRHLFKRIRMFIGPVELVELHRRGRRARRRRGAGSWATSASRRSATRWSSTATRSG